MSTHRVTITLEVDLECEDTAEAQWFADSFAQHIVWPAGLADIDDVEVAAIATPIEDLPEPSADILKGALHV